MLYVWRSVADVTDTTGRLNHQTDTSYVPRGGEITHSGGARRLGKKAKSAAALSSSKRWSRQERQGARQRRYGSSLWITQNASDDKNETQTEPGTGDHWKGGQGRREGSSDRGMEGIIYTTDTDQVMCDLHGLGQVTSSRYKMELDEEDIGLGKLGIKDEMAS